MIAQRTGAWVEATARATLRTRILTRPHTMDYELAKKLQDAGFPQAGKGSWIGPSSNLIWRSSDRVYNPILSELIEACRDEFDNLNRLRTTGTLRFQAAGAGKIGDGSTPEEAVARLWLALNEK